MEGAANFSYVPTCSVGGEAYISLSNFEILIEYIIHADSSIIYGPVPFGHNIKFSSLKTSR
jgi:hypothetical protein